MSDHFDALGVPRGATTSEIKRAYRALALRWHPDKNPGDREAAEAKFVAISAAAEVLCDDQKRAAYDRGGSAMTSFARPGGGFGGFDMRSAEAMFHASFGESLAASWQPGSRVSGALSPRSKRCDGVVHLISRCVIRHARPRRQKGDGDDTPGRHVGRARGGGQPICGLFVRLPLVDRSWRRPLRLFTAVRLLHSTAVSRSWRRLLHLRPHLRQPRPGSARLAPPAYTTVLNARVNGWRTPTQALADYLVPQSMQRATLSSADSQFRISTESSLALLILNQASPLGRLRHEPCDQPKNCSSLVRL